MKIKLQYFIFLFICISCSNSDDNNPEAKQEFELPPKTEIREDWKNLIIGKWKYIQQCEYGITGGGCYESPTTYYTFKNDSIVLYNFSNDCEEGRYNIDGRIINFTFECANHAFDTEIRTLSQNFLVFHSTGDDSSIYRVYEKVNN